ncbi:hypothetical protein H8356DRAFT_1672902 [Neocallimastix lanati (nom. inval.)]|jgi:hypothetical protein|uniref:Uncharacterized protein n=1 Tax=Neocallimastix californiae TaxID=1754190 RepID=A0A1Y2BCV6_9FUNG|nr:hypothetical protein H8356DRAFT_1672902 [Neocallimastix sp. JGI-2020a]ORY32668.1 hypothetical protein LY90DRAFT_705189 [Neocallimastix californiae]|eukprot:ORY32668.1 hypothetical protein LY90DRAFT_705189 [Neocallimastix californiae]
MFDERIMNLLEAASLGNLKAVKFYVNAGVNVNGQHQMNKYTPLHWAVTRGHTSVVQYLLSNGADPTIKNAKGEIPADLSKTEEMSKILHAELPKEIKKLPINFELSYIKNPDLLKVWSSPDELPEEKTFTQIEQERKEAELRKQQLQKQEEPVTEDNEKEFLIYKDEQSINNLLGCVSINETRPIEDLVLTIKEEIDDSSELKTIYKMNGSLKVPVNKKQYKYAIKKIFKTTNIVII